MQYIYIRCKKKYNKDNTIKKICVVLDVDKGGSNDRQ